MAVYHIKDREKFENAITTGHFRLVSLRKTRAVKSHSILLMSSFSY